MMRAENLLSYTVKNTLKIEICIIVIFLATFVRFSLRTTKLKILVLPKHKKKIFSGMIGQQEVPNSEIFRENSLFFKIEHQTYLFLL
jgi:hypothetical protein